MASAREQWPPVRADGQCCVPSGWQARKSCPRAPHLSRRDQTPPPQTSTATCGPASLPSGATASQLLKEGSAVGTPLLSIIVAPVLLSSRRMWLPRRDALKGPGGQWAGPRPCNRVIGVRHNGLSGSVWRCACVRVVMLHLAMQTALQSNCKSTARLHCCPVARPATLRPTTPRVAAASALWAHAAFARRAPTCPTRVWPFRDLCCAKCVHAQPMRLQCGGQPQTCVDPRGGCNILVNRGAPPQAVRGLARRRDPTYLASAAGTLPSACRTRPARARR